MADRLQVGDGATYCGFSDKQAGTIIARTAKTITWQRDKATLLNSATSGEKDALTYTPGGFAGHMEGKQRHSYERDESGIIRKFTLRSQTGRWMITGAKANGRAGQLIEGRHEHYDFNF